MAFRDLDEFLTVKPLVLPIGGKEYAFPGDVGGASWLLLQRVGQRMRYGEDPDAVAMTNAEETALKAEMFGAARDEMIADGCTSTHMQAVFQTLLAFHLSGRDTAEMVWNAQGEAPAPNRAARRHPPKKATSGTAKSTRLRGSTPGTTSAKTKTPAPATPGPTSLSTGT